jgi:hypothetical protein
MKSTTLIDISKELLALNDALDALDGEDEQAAELQAWFDELLAETTEARNAKLDNYAALIGELEARAAARRAEAARLADRARADENRAKWLKQALQDHFAQHGLKTVETARYRLTLAQNGGKAPLIVEEDKILPTQLPVRFQSVDFNHGAIRAALEAGEQLGFARLGERGQSIRIK